MFGLFKQAVAYVGRVLGTHQPKSHQVNLTPRTTPYRGSSQSRKTHDERNELIGEALSWSANGRPILEYLPDSGDYLVRDVASGVTAQIHEDAIPHRYLEQLVDDAAAWELAEKNARNHPYFNRPRT